MDIFVPALWIASGISFFSGIQFTILGLVRRQERVFLAFGLLCLLLAAYMNCSAAWYRATDVASAAVILRFQMGLACLVYPTFVWFLYRFSYEDRVGRFFWVISTAFAVLFIVNLYSPYSFPFERIEMGRPIALPWGETVSHFKLFTAPIAWPYYIAVYSVFAWSFYRCVVLWRRKSAKRAMTIGIYMAVQLLAVLHAELVDNLHWESVYLAELTFLILVVLVTATLVWELRARSMALEQSVSDLRAETEQRQRYENRLEYLAHHDYLTDLPNRRSLTGKLEAVRSHCQASGASGAMLLIDLDNFKMVNDALGHDVGDELLQMTARRLEDHRRAHGQPIRLGGDEFALLCKALPADRQLAEQEAMRQAAAVRDEFLIPFRIGEHELVVGASMGIAVFDGHTVDLADIIKCADMALYRAKSNGRNSVELFVPELQRQADRHLAIARGMRRAIENGDIAIAFQPQVDHHHRVVGAEVLARWQHPELGIITPGEFILVAEETGLIHALGEHVLEQACSYLRNTVTDGSVGVPRLSVNVSAWQLDSPVFVLRTREIVERNGAEPERITLEITENSFLRDMASVSRRIRELSEMGVRFSIDDFGTGYSALNTLKQLSVHELKIDRSFTADLAAHRTDRVVETILAIARHMDLEVIAEGVETVDQRDQLQRMGCRVFQGFLISRPLSAAELTAWLTQHAGRA